jgi:ribosomal protein S12 methylthiotransferase accessory factor YcaO
MIREFDAQSEEGRAALAGVAAQASPALAAMAARMGRLFVIDMPDSPGLVLVGGEISSSVAGPSHPVTTVPSAGVGETLSAALLGCLGEAAERVSAFEQPGDVVRRASASTLPPDLAGGYDAASVIAVMDGWDTRGRPVPIPADLCLRRARYDTPRLVDEASSTGMAAGRDREDATRRAMLELVERDSAAAWWIGGRRGRPLADDAAAIARMRGESPGDEMGHRRTWTLDLTGDLGVPVVAGLSCGPRGTGLACGVAARETRAAALAAALDELAALEVGLLLATVKRDPNPVDRRHLRRAALDALSCPLLRPEGTPVSDDPVDVAQALDRAGIERYVVDLSRPCVGVMVVKVVAPALQLMPGGSPTRRLADVRAAHGGGERWTIDVPLF